jgi:hypothetical protein
MTDDALDIILALIRQMEAAILELHQVRARVCDDSDRNAMNPLITAAEARLLAIKRRIIQ